MTKSFADRLFDASLESVKLEDEFFEKILQILGVDLDHCPFEDTGFDWYDRSFEVYGARPDLTLTPDQQQEFWKLGFICGWINCNDKTERHYWRDSVQMGFPNGSEKAVTHPRVPRDSQILFYKSELSKARAPVDRQLRAEVPGTAPEKPHEEFNYAGGKEKEELEDARRIR